ncbi:MAG: NAD(P)-dependent oxidoreductase [Victivallales bacterium]|nr:NAD(P)-dependent oxidoreductase [Victivallales bacterium]
MRICWIGTGVMGAPMVGHLLDAGHECTVCTRTREKAEALIARGARWAGTPAEAAEGAEFAGVMVGMPSDVEQVVLGAGGIMERLGSGALLSDFTTSSPELAVRIAAFAEGRGVSALDSPVSGGDVGARNAALSIMVGGDSAAFERALPVYRLLGKTVELQGPAGAGQHTKMVNQILICGTMAGVCEALLYARKSGLDPEQVLKNVGGGAAASWALENMAPRIIKDDFEPGFYVEHFVKDMEIALAESARMGIDLPALKLVHSLYVELRDGLGMGRKGTQALVKVLEKL